MTETSVRCFEVYPCGDPCSRAWDATEYERYGDDYGTYRGDLSGMYSRRQLVEVLRRLYPGCRIRRRVGPELAIRR